MNSQQDNAAIREPEHDINGLFLERWSSRTFEDREVPEDALLSVFEAAKWAPSANNVQPWRYIVARSKQDRDRFMTFINEGNRRWCGKAPVLALLVSERVKPDGNENGAHAFDAGTSWGFLALEAINQGLATRAMGGFDKDKARQSLGIPDSYALHCVIAIGYRGDKQSLPEDLRERELPTPRRPVMESLFEGKYGDRWNSGGTV